MYLTFRQRQQYIIQNMNIERKELIFQLVRFILGGISTTCICWGSIVALVELGKLHYLLANNIGGSIALLYSYLINKYLVFKNRKRVHLKHGSKFVILQLLLIGLSNIILFVGVQCLEIHYFIVVVLMSIFLAALNFSIMKIAVFT